MHCPCTCRSLFVMAGRQACVGKRDSVRYGYGMCREEGFRDSERYGSTEYYVYTESLMCDHLCCCFMHVLHLFSQQAAHFFFFCMLLCMSPTPLHFKFARRRRCSVGQLGPSKALCAVCPDGARLSTEASNRQPQMYKPLQTYARKMPSSSALTQYPGEHL